MDKYGGIAMFKSLTLKITTAMILMVSVCTLLFTLVSYFELKTSVEKQMENDGRTLITTVRREIGKYKIQNLADIQAVFQEVKKESGGNIEYISLSDNNSKILVSDSSKLAAVATGEVNSGGGADATSSATASEDVSSVVNTNEIVGSTIKNADNKDVYNISAPLYSGSDLTGVLNLGISLDGMNKQIASTLTVILLEALLIELVTIVIALFVSKTLTRPIRNIVKELDGFSKGDFTISFSTKSKDEIRSLTASLNNSVSMLKSTIQVVVKAVDKLYGIASDLSASGQETSASTEEIVASIAEVTDEIKNEDQNISRIVQTFEEFSSKLDKITHQAGDVYGSSEKIKERAISGESNLNELVNSMDTVRESFDLATTDILALNDDISRINQIIEVINGVAEQTNMLALNAAIESARAGEAGKGFAVVADEIRKLAEEVLKSSKDINAIIRDIIENTRSVVEDNKAISGKMELQKTIAGETVNSLVQINSEVDNTLANMKDVIDSLSVVTGEKEQIFNSVDEISKISDQVAVSSQEISEAVQQQSQNVYQLSSLASELNNIADQLKKDVSTFKT